MRRVLNYPVAVVNRLIQYSSDSAGRWIVDIIANNLDGSVQPRVLAKPLENHALHNPDPEEELWRVEVSSGQTYYSGDPHFHAINTVRGNAAKAVAQIISRSKTCWEVMRIVIEKMVGDPSIAVRTNVDQVCCLVLNYDRTEAIRLFLLLVDTDDKLLGTCYVYDLLYHTCDSDFDNIKSVVVRMIHSSISEVRKNAGKIAAVASLYGSIDQFC